MKHAFLQAVHEEAPQDSVTYAEESETDSNVFENTVQDSGPDNEVAQVDEPDEVEPEPEPEPGIYYIAIYFLYYINPIGLSQVFYILTLSLNHSCGICVFHALYAHPWMSTPVSIFVKFDAICNLIWS